MPLAPEYQAMLQQLAAQEGPPITALEPTAARQLYRLMRPVDPLLAGARITEHRCPGPAGDIPLRVYRPPGDTPVPIMVFFHGGGWVIGDLDTADAACRLVTATTGCVVVSVDYRLAPEHPYPAAVEDAMAATRWVAEQAQELRGNGQLIVAGESAGGTLAAVVARLARDDGGPHITCQLLLYPVVDCDLGRDSYRSNGEGYLLETATMRWFWDHYCPDPGRRQDPDAAPLRAASLAGLPPALVVTAEFDPLRDEGEAYGAALRAAGTVAEVMRCAGLPHDFLATAGQFECSRRPFEAIMAALQRLLMQH
jgi:acetyl esterase